MSRLSINDFAMANSIEEATDPNRYYVTEHRGYFYKAASSWRGPFSSSQQALDDMAKRNVHYGPGSLVHGTALCKDNGTIASFVTGNVTEISITDSKTESAEIRYPVEPTPPPMRMINEGSIAFDENRLKPSHHLSLLIKEDTKKLLAIAAGAFKPIINWFKVQPNSSK